MLYAVSPMKTCCGPILTALAACSNPKAASAAPVIQALSPADSIAATQLPSGYRLEAVLTEPDIAEPVMISFDGSGRMYVAEMRTYMQDADGSGQMEPFSRVSRHEDTDGDGVYDKHTVFADKLLLPRILLPLDERVIIGEMNTDDLFVYRDKDGDGVADEKTLWFAGGPRGGNIQHQPNGLVWALDNWLYGTYYDYRLRVGADGKAIKETIPVNGGQWGLTQDDWGKVWFVNAGNETGPVHFQQHILYGQFKGPNELIGDYRTVWPIARVPDDGFRFTILNEEGVFDFALKTLKEGYTAMWKQAVLEGTEFKLVADLKKQLEQVAEGKNTVTMTNPLLYIAIGNIWILTELGELPNDEFNGLLYAHGE